MIGWYLSIYNFVVAAAAAVAAVAAVAAAQSKKKRRDNLCVWLTTRHQRAQSGESLRIKNDKRI